MNSLPSLPSSFSDDEDMHDEGFFNYLTWERKVRVVKPRIDHFNEMEDRPFFNRFRLKKETVLFVLTKIEEAIETPTDRNQSIPPISKLLLTLRYYATGSMLIVVADFSGVSKTAACLIVRQVSQAIADLAPVFISMPSTPAAIQSARHAFYSRASFPRVIGAIDCTHVRIQSPGGTHAENFRNRKGYFSINVQTVSSENLKILDIVARWPGSAHDQTIFNKSRLRRRLVEGEFGDSLIVGDSGYANTPFLATPFLQAPTPAHQLYNESIIRTRNPVERQYGVIKRRFPILSLGIRLKLETTQAVIIATAVLHNIAIEKDSEMPEADPDIEMIPDEDLTPTFRMDADTTVNARDQLLNEYFANLI